MQVATSMTRVSPGPRPGTMKMCWTACAVGDDDDTPRSTIKHYEDVLDRVRNWRQ